MKVLVSIKRVVDFNVKVRVKADGTGVETANVKMSMNPFDEIAVEEAVRLREAGVATEIYTIAYTLSLHDALPIYQVVHAVVVHQAVAGGEVDARFPLRV